MSTCAIGCRVVVYDWILSFLLTNSLVYIHHILHSQYQQLPQFPIPSTIAKIEEENYSVQQSDMKSPISLPNRTSLTNPCSKMIDKVVEIVKNN